MGRLGFEAVPAATFSSPQVFPWIAALGTAVCGVGDFLASGEGVTMSSLLAAAGISMVGGLLLGTAISLLWSLLRNHSRPVKAVAWAIAGALPAMWVVRELGVIARLGGETLVEGLAALVGSGLAAISVALLGLSLQPDRAGSVWASGSRRRRILWSIACGLGAAGCAVVDRMIDPEQYRAAHALLRWMSFGGLSVAFATALTRLPKIGLGSQRVLLGLGVAAMAWPFLMLHAEDEEEIHGLLESPFSAASMRMIRVLGDVDGDGSSVLLGGGDCAPFDPAIHPAARDIPRNGIDENCRRGDAGAVDVSAEEVPIPTKPSPTSVVLVTIDTLQGKATSFGGPVDTTPNLAEWARGALRFDRAYTSGAWTSLAIPAIFRGIYPRRLNWTRLIETNKYRLLRKPLEPQLAHGEVPKLMFGLPIEDPRPQLQWWLQRRGMVTAAVVDDGFTGYFDVEVGAFPDFDHYVELKAAGRRSDDKAVTDEALDLLDDLPKDRPFFLWVHYFGPHTPVARHKEAPSFGRGTEGQYHHEIAWTDVQVSRFLKGLDAQVGGLPVAVFLTADHGETIKANGKRRHGVTLDEDEIHVPLLVRGPGIKAGVSQALVSTVDIFPTVMAMTQTPGPSGLDGLNLVDVQTHPASVADRVLIAETWRFTGAEQVTVDMLAAFDGKLKVIWNRLDESRAIRTQPDQKKRKRNAKGSKRLIEAIDAYLELTGPPQFED